MKYKTVETYIDEQKCSLLKVRQKGKCEVFIKFN